MATCASVSAFHPHACAHWLPLAVLLTEHPRQHASVKLLCELGLYDDAVSLALAVDLDLAKAVASSPEDDDALRRKLWLSIAKHVVQVGNQAWYSAGGKAKQHSPSRRVN